jgi:beta-RFAP synthase
MDRLKDRFQPVDVWGGGLRPAAASEPAGNAEVAGGRVVRVTAPSRLHFGMLSVGNEAARRYGGVGVMIDHPRIVLAIRDASRLEAAGPLADRARGAAMLVAQALGCEPHCRIAIEEAPPQHVGLGSGTQLAMAVAAGLCALWGRGNADAATLARWVGRGRRSAIGTHGFARGGLLYEAGKADEESLAPLVERVQLPEAWRFVLVRPPEPPGLHGDAEQRAFAALPPVPRERTEALRCKAENELIPAAAAGDFANFSESLYEFGHLAGLSFASRQGGAFAGPRLAALVEWLRGQGIDGVGQSSWGPTLFALTASERSAIELVAKLQGRPDGKTLELSVARPENHGARLEITQGETGSDSSREG